ncbi:MAG: C25 family cysteine peptidase [bacterium]
MSKKLVLAAILSLFMFLSAAAERIDLGTIPDDVQATVLESNEARTIVRFDIGAFDRAAVDIDGNTFYQIECGEESNLLNAGEPALPRLCRSIIIPDDARVELSVISSEYQDFAGTPVVPSKGNLLRTVNPEEVPYEFGTVYSTADWYPAQLADVREPFILRDYRGTVIDLNAFQYNADSKTLRVYTSVTVEVATVGQSEINVFTNRQLPLRLVNDFEVIYQRQFLNYESFGKRYSMVPETGDYLIITYDAFHAAMQEFVDWKTQKGIPTTIVDVSTIGNTSTAIKNYIQNAYNTTDLAFVLLVGDAAQIATMSASGGSSDPSYVKLAGGDDYPDAIIGRFSAENVAQVETQVERTITYERDSPGLAWFHKGTGIASSQGAGQGHNGGEADYVHMGKIRDSLLSFTYTEVDEIYEPGATAGMVTTALNQGRSIINYCGHGSTTAWSTTGFSNTNVDALVNDNMLPFIISVACVNGQFAGYTCFGEAWLRATHSGVPTGAIGAYMSSINQSWAPPMDAEDEVTHLLIHEVRTSYGGLCFNASCKMIEINGADGVEMYDTWHIFGDPTVQVRTDQPAAMTVSHPGAVFFQSPTYEVNVSGGSGALCALYYDGTLYGAAYADFAGYAEIDILEPLPIGVTVTLTVTDFNKLTFVDDVQVTSDLAIVHSPLGDTKDAVNDYLVQCQIYTNSTLDADSLLLFYDAGAGYQTELLQNVGAPEDFEAYIPAQSPGTTISYYMYAVNEAGYRDTTDTFTFKVIDYQMILDPLSAFQTAPSEDIAWYDFTVTNDGVLDDDYSLVVSGVWDASVWDETGTSEISSTGTLAMDESLDFKVRVVLPVSVYGECDQTTLTVTSSGNPSITAAAEITTCSAGQPLSLPFYESFAALEIDTTMWDEISGVTVNEQGLGEPSPPYAANFDGSPSGGDMLTSQSIDLGGTSGLNISYAYQRGGGGESPDDGEDLVVRYLNSSEQWVVLNTHLGSGPDMTEFETVTIPVPLDGYHSLFQIRFSNTATSGDYDDWFVDDIRIDYGPSISATPSSFTKYLDFGASSQDILTIANAGPGGLTYSINVAPDFSRVSQVFQDLYDLGQVNPASYKYEDGWRSAELPKGVDDTFRGPDVRFNAGGPDIFGYIWVDSDEGGGPAYDWIDITATGTNVVSSLTDDSYSGPYPIGFDFPFYDGIYTEFYISSNGFIGFGPTTDYGSLSNTAIPTSTTPNNAIFWCWDDLHPSQGDGTTQVLYDVVGGKLVVEFYHYAEYDVSGSGDMITAEVILSPDGDIKLQYDWIEGGFITTESTIGIEDEIGSDGLQIVHNGAYLHEGLAIEITKPAEWLLLSSYSGELAPGEFDDITVTFDATEAEEGVYQSIISVSSNDPDPGDNPLLISAQLTVGGGGTPPPVPGLMLPHDAETIHTSTPEFCWTSTAGTGGYYLLQCSLDPSFETDVWTIGAINDTTCLFPSELTDGTWYWHVQAINSPGLPSGYQEQAYSFLIESWIPGDADFDGIVNITDAVYLINFIFSEGPAPVPVVEAGDANCDGASNITDAVLIIDYIFNDGPAPCQ